jgi:hypothetical protein
MAQQELLHLHETYDHADMQEIQHKIKIGDIKSTQQVVKMPNLIREQKQKEIHKNRGASITAQDKYPGTSTYIDHEDAANVPGYTWHTKLRLPSRNTKTLCSLLTTQKLVYPSFQETKTGEEALCKMLQCRH